MNSLLKQNPNWQELARKANWSVSELSRLCNVSSRTLERYFQKKMGVSPKSWLSEQRQKRAVELLKDGSPIKEVASHLGYRYPHNFSSEFKKHWGVCPTSMSSSSSAHSVAI